MLRGYLPPPARKTTMTGESCTSQINFKN